VIDGIELTTDSVPQDRHVAGRRGDLRRRERRPAPDHQDRSAAALHRDARPDRDRRQRLLFMLTSWIAGKFDLPFHVEDFWPSAVLGALLVGVVSGCSTCWSGRVDRD
jgi:hypothetical protein